MLHRSPARAGLRTLTFTLPLEWAGRASVVGNFNDWQPHRHPMIRRQDGTLTTTVLAASGSTLHFRYLGTDGWWFDDNDADYVDRDGSYVVA